MPAVPAFAGDLQAEEALGTRAIMEFQYNSISRGGYSIIEQLRKAGIRDPGRYIGFYNLRNFDRINTSRTMADVEARAGVSYEEARRERDQELGGYPDSGNRGGDENRGYSESRGYQSERSGGRYDRDDNRGGYSDSRYGGRPRDDDYRGGYQGDRQGGRDAYSHPRADPRFENRPQRQEYQGGYSGPTHGGRPHDDDYGRRPDYQDYGRRPERGDFSHPGADPRFDGRQEPGRYQGGYDESRHDSRPQRQEYQGGGGYSEHSRYEYSRYEQKTTTYEQQPGRPSHDRYDRYQQEARKVADSTLDTISSCYMDQGPRVTDLRWDGNPEDEINAFVTEELYIHSKLLIVDDRLVICGSANLNDRSQLGSHDSEIAVVIEDPTPVESYMDGRPYTASRFASSLRRYIFRKHLGLIPDQRWDQPDQNWTPVDRDRDNVYDWGSPADLLVRDPLHPKFQQVWADTARVNTETFSRAFHPVPNDHVRTWKDYDDFFARHFIIPGKKGQKPEEEAKKGKVEYGHIVREEFPGGVGEVKQWLSRIRGTLVEMPLDFLVDVDDIAKEGLTLNDLTNELYT